MVIPAAAAAATAAFA
ncbi:hypothetical protein YPPY52_3542, partial [Yersinia pestis PY-52]